MLEPAYGLYNAVPMGKTPPFDTDHARERRAKLRGIDNSARRASKAKSLFTPIALYLLSFIHVFNCRTHSGNLFQGEK